MQQIAFIAGSYQPQRCGVAHYTHHLRRSLAQQQLFSQVLTTRSAAEFTVDPTIAGVVPDWRFGTLLELVNAVHRSDADLLHIQHAAGTYGFDRSIFLLPLLLRLSGWQRPIVTTIHEYGWWEWQPSWLPATWLESLKQWGQNRGWWDREDGFLLTQSDAIITTTATAAAVVVERLPQLQPRVHRIPIAANVEVTPIDRATARQRLRQTCGWDSDTAVVAFFGFLHPVKGLETLLSAFQQVFQRQPQARLLLLGGVETLALPGEQATRYWQQLQSRIDQLDLQSVVRMTGYLEADVTSHYLSGADIGVLPFHHGVTLKSGSLLTLMAHQLPVIATAAATDSHLLQPVVRRVTPRQVDELAAAIESLLTHPEQRQQLAVAGEDYSRQFTWSHITEAHRTVYQSVLGSCAKHHR
jgi:polysaccharide biosynthesis protein PslF